jgi:hypothetical protein
MHRLYHHLLLANKPWRRRDGISKILRPHSTVELNVCLINLPITAENEDVKSLDRCSAWVQDESPAPSDDIASVPDVESSDLIDAVARVCMTSLDRCKVWLGDGSISRASEEVDAIRDLLVIRIGDRLDEGVEGCSLVAVGLLRLDEGVDECGSLGIG